MEKIQHNYYQCVNADCGLRFPGTERFPRFNRCPMCRSEVRLVVSVEKIVNEDRKVNFFRYPLDALVDNVRSALNVGSIFRTAEGTGINKLYLCGITPTPDNPKVRKTSLGAEGIIPWERFANGVNLVFNLRKNGYKIWVLENIPESVPLFQIDLPQNHGPIVLAVGNEISGIDPGIIEAADQVISIPMIGKKSSYNVSIAFGIAVSFLLYRQSVSQGSRNILPKT